MVGFKTKKELSRIVPMDTLIIKNTAASRSWISLDCTGRATMLDVDIMDRVQIHARDMRILDPLSCYPCAILGRKRAIVLNLEHIKAIITSEEVLLQDPKDDNVIPIVEELKRRLPLAGKEDESPFEFRALEVALEGICNFLDARAKELEISAYPELDKVTCKTSSRRLDRVRKLIKSELIGLTVRIQKVRDELEKLLKDDNNMADLYLSRKLASSSPIRASRDEHDVKELKVLLEPYFMQAERTLSILTTLRENIDVTNENRKNQLKVLKLILECATFCIAMYSVVPGIFGMNIPFTWDHAPYGFMFKWVIILPVVVCAAVFVGIVSYARHKGLGSCE
ncbi:hypothetical protein MKW94_029999 [Papaver nudicaule]|uniref:Magnesium transporter n=1 Tax=Papaver nudicaule TaxID=74823 RepID=A0AA41V0I5_PAPNU|nr:hypothetical protein [Papaver nudicaule]